ncbi:putative receptor-like protein kinase-like [Dorcoceras hygrometricum]|uniref:Putative receptor-like protein kinase-like n=1 Tax=Dorcoceras hygrometricum TaxID=472368 RepID=A0A2Z7CWQ3_9LAMI|nr:putative receptor-like protein kinase-like [Dorcoceras hygrometricum]
MGYKMQAGAVNDNQKNLRCYNDVQYLGLLNIKILEHRRQIWKVPLEDESPSLSPGELISSTNTHQPQLCVTHLFYAYVRNATDTEFNVFVLGRDLILHFGLRLDYPTTGYTVALVWIASTTGYTVALVWIASKLLITTSSNRNADVIIADSRFLFTSTSDSFTFAQQLINIVWTASELHLHAPAGPDINHRSWLPDSSISFANHQYVVESISDVDPIIRVHDAALLTFNSNTTCLPELTNTTLPTSEFRYFNTTMLNLFPLCRRNGTTGMWPYRVICRPQDDDQIWNLAIQSGDDPADLQRAIQNCERYIVAPVNYGYDNIYTSLRRGVPAEMERRKITGRGGEFWTPPPPNSGTPPPASSGTPHPASSGTPPPATAGKGVGVPAVIVVVSSILLILFRKNMLTWLCIRKADGENQVDIELYLKNHGDLAPKRYKYSHLRKITNSFAESLGKGGFDSVYKGELQDGRLVAVKILNESKGNGEEFINEVSSISTTSHVNVVALLGFCFEGSKRALVYEFMPNGSLEKFIPDSTPSPTTKA